MMDIKNVHSLAPLRKLDYNYGGPPLRTFGDRYVRLGSQARSGRARADRFAGFGRTFKSLLARVADYFSSAASRSGRRFARAHEAYSREADKLLRELAAKKGSATDPEKLMDRLCRLSDRADEMAKHIAMEGPDGGKMTRKAAKAMGKDRLEEWSGQQARALRKELLTARVRVALDKAVGQRERVELEEAFNAIDWRKVEEGLEKESDRRLGEALESSDEFSSPLSRESQLIMPAVKTTVAFVDDLRTIHDVFVTSDMLDIDPYGDIGDGLDGILQSMLGALDDEAGRRDLLFGETLGALGQMRDAPRYVLERVFRQVLDDAGLSPDVAARLHGKLVEDSPTDLADLRFAASFPESGKETLKAIADRLPDVDSEVDEELADLRQDLKTFLTLTAVLAEQAGSSGKPLRDQGGAPDRSFADSIIGDFVKLDSDD